MWCLEANKQDAYYSIPNGTSEVRDSQNYRTGEKVIAYMPPVKTRLSFSKEGGGANFDNEGLVKNYSLSFVTDDMNCPITEGTLIWYGRPTSQSANYIVVSKEKHLNEITYRVKDYE